MKAPFKRFFKVGTSSYDPASANSLYYDLKELIPRIDGRNGYLVAIHHRISCLAKESSATAACPRENVWDLLGTITHEWQGQAIMNSMKARVLTLMNAMDRQIRPANDDTHTIADIASSATDVSLIHTVSNIFAPRALNPYLDGSLAGAIPLAAAGSEFRISITCGLETVLGGAWGVTGNATLETYAEVVYDERVLYPQLVRVYDVNTTDSPYTLDAIGGKVDMLLVLDDAGASFTIPTVAFDTLIDGTPVQSGMTGTDFLKNKTLRMEDGLDDIFDLGFLPIILPTDFPRHNMIPSGARIQVVNAAATHASSAKYLYRVMSDLPAAMKARVFAQAKIPAGAGRFKVNGVSKAPVMSDMLGADVEIE